MTKLSYCTYKESCSLDTHVLVTLLTRLRHYRINISSLKFIDRVVCDTQHTHTFMYNLVHTYIHDVYTPVYTYSSHAHHTSQVSPVLLVLLLLAMVVIWRDQAGKILQSAHQETEIKLRRHKTIHQSETAEWVNVALNKW